MLKYDLREHNDPLYIRKQLIEAGNTFERTHFIFQGGTEIVFDTNSDIRYFIDGMNLGIVLSPKA